MSAGPLTQKVLDFTRTMERLVPGVKDPAGWAPLADFVATDAFERIGTFLEVHDWQAYTEMLTRWASKIEKFETRVLRIGELRDRVYYEVEEHHYRGDAVHVVNSMTVFAFGDDGRIRHLAVYLQQPR